MLGFLLVSYILASYGITNLLVYGTGPFDVLSKMRDWCDEHIPTIGDMLKCMMCTSTNVGWIVSLLNLMLLPEIPFTPFNIIFDTPYLWPIIIVLDASITSGSVWLLHTIQEALERWNND